MRPGEADDLVNDPTGLSRGNRGRPDEPQTPRVPAVFSCLLRQATEAAWSGYRNRKQPQTGKEACPMRRELLNQGLMYGLVSLFVFIVAPLVT